MTAVAFALSLVLATGCRSPDETQVAAAVSLRDALVDLGGDADKDRGVRFHFAASGVLLRQALEGAPFDVIVLAGEEEMDRLAAADVIDATTRRTIATNSLVLGVPAWGERADSLADLTRPVFSRIAIGSPSTVPVGRYAEQVLRASGLWEELEPRLVLAGHARHVVQYLERGEVDAGIVYRSDVESTAGIEVCAEIDAALHAPIRYQAAVMRDAGDVDGAGRFLRILAGPRGDVSLRRHGFSPPP